MPIGQLKWHARQKRATRYYSGLSPLYRSLLQKHSGLHHSCPWQFSVYPPHAWTDEAFVSCAASWMVLLTQHAVVLPLIVCLLPTRKSWTLSASRKTSWSSLCFFALGVGWELGIYSCSKGRPSHHLRC